MSVINHVFLGKGINMQELQPQLVQSIFLNSSQFWAGLAIKCLDLQEKEGGLGKEST